MGALEDAWHVYKARVGAPDPAAAAATAAALAGAGFTTVASPALRPAQRAALVRDTSSNHHLLQPSMCLSGARFPFLASLLSRPVQALHCRVSMAILTFASRKKL